MFYSFQNNYPVPKSEIPNRLRMPDGTTRTIVGDSIFTEEELNQAGWILVNDPPFYDSNRSRLTWGITEDESYGWVIEEIPEIEKAIEVRKSRDARMHNFAWRIDRHLREKRLGLVPTDDIDELDTYMQRLADIPEQPGFPWEINWPQEPTSPTNSVDSND